jgi:N-acetylglucosaminyl-diphospho-decaprenol L-rhamnosyltransferase
MRPLIDVSVVNHGHGSMVGKLVAALLSFPEVGRIIVTRNIADADGVVESDRILLIQNATPKGFGANHNAAFVNATAPLFCVLNPDIEFRVNPFPALLASLHCCGASMLAPSVVNCTGRPEDSVRYFPTVRQLASKMLGRHDGRYALQKSQSTSSVDWVAGMFMLWVAEDYKAIGGFDEKFYLYYEDVDICIRLWKSGRSVMVDSKVQVVHDAQRTSHKDWRFMKWHIASLSLIHI